MAADEKFRTKLGIALWEMACDVGRSPMEKAWGISHRYTEHLFVLAIEWAGSLREAKCPSEWSKEDIEKHNVKRARDALEHAIKQRDHYSTALERSSKSLGEITKQLDDLLAALASTKGLLADRNADVDLARKERDDALAAVARLEKSHCVLMNERDDLRRARAEAQAETLQVRTAWAHVVDERDKALRELEVAYRDRNAYHVALDKIVKLAGEIRRVADGFSTK